MLKLTKPRARLSKSETKSTLFSCLGEFLWYLAKTNELDFIRYYISDYAKYSDDGKTIFGAYGPRFFSMRGINQVANVVRLLERKPHSRQAVIQLFDAADIVKAHKDIPCTCTLQFMIRRRRLHMFIYMRSNDAFLGLPHDVFCFTMLQEMAARQLGVGLGTYHHAVGSLHLYRKHRKLAGQYVKEGWLGTIPMAPMPKGNPWKAANKVVRAERLIRHGQRIDIDKLQIENYWKDLVRLLQIYSHFKRREVRAIERLKPRMSSRSYDRYIDDKIRAARTRAGTK